MGSKKPLHFCRYLELKENVSVSRILGKKISQPTEPCLTCRAGIHPTLPALPALLVAASLGQVEMLSFTDSVTTTGVGGLRQLTSSSAEGRKGESSGPPWPCPPHKGRGWRLAGVMEHRVPSCRLVLQQMGDLRGTAQPCKLSEPSELRRTPPFPTSCIPPSASAASSAALQPDPDLLLVSESVAAVQPFYSDRFSSM